MSILPFPNSSSEPTPLRPPRPAPGPVAVGTRAGDTSEASGVSEAELLALHVGESCVRLENRFDELLPLLKSLGPVVALTRNAFAVHEKRGVYRHLEAQGSEARFLGEEFELRLFLSHWRHAFAFQEGESKYGRRSLQFFDEAGAAIHRIVLEEGSNIAAFERLVAEFASGEQSPRLGLSPRGLAATPLPDIAVDVQGLRRAWLALRDTQAFHWMLRRFEVTRVQALRLVGSDLARAVDPSALLWTLERARDRGISLRISVGNRGSIQSHLGHVQTVRSMGAWLSVQDPGFKLHVRTDPIASAWVVRKPTVDGVVTSVELFDAEGEPLALLSGNRKSGQPELSSWRALTEELARKLALPEELP
ncbi:hemin-degrading factor [Hyalangium versicolor]|uniref:hemin-degrading factor n=1 Tax=Hyalangium versicolor TaxID=2861190 RepID=UPI001CCB8F0A|nr:ChuX/HutX family heme-like substrate-binding protein [Hyalangium versicolor]